MFEYLSQIDRFLHVLFGITWIGLLYYFNFVGAGYLKDCLLYTSPSPRDEL